MAPNKEKHDAYQKQYKLEHKAEHAKYMNEYVKASPTILCACGGKYKQYAGYKHKQSQRHLSFIEGVEKQAAEADKAKAAAEAALAEAAKKPKRVKKVVEPLIANIDELQIESLHIKAPPPTPKPTRAVPKLKLVEIPVEVIPDVVVEAKPVAVQVRPKSAKKIAIEKMFHVEAPIPTPMPTPEPKEPSLAKPVRKVVRKPKVLVIEPEKLNFVM